jgi:hypothetical protein
VTAVGHRVTHPRQLFLRAAFLLASYPLVAADCPAPTILLNAFDHDLKMQSGLRASDLRVEVDRRPVQILSLSLDADRRRIVLLVDSSLSMEASPQEPGWGIALPVAGYAVDVMPASAVAALVTFSDTVQRQSSDFQSPRLVGAALVDLKNQPPKGRTLLFDSIHQILTGFTELRSGDAIYVVTDGIDNKSTISHAKLRQELIARGIRVFAFVIRARPRSMAQEELIGVDRMENLAVSTGGDVMEISASDLAENSRARLNKLASHIAAEVESVYRVELGISTPASIAPTKVSFVDRGRTRNGYIAYSREIAPCTSTTN